MTHFFFLLQESDLAEWFLQHNHLRPRLLSPFAHVLVQLLGLLEQLLPSAQPHPEPDLLRGHLLQHSRH